MATGAPRTIGEYEILEEIGHGGMGTLYRARDPHIDRVVAVKLLREGLDDDEMRERFVREARAAGKLKHGNIVTIFELGEYGGMPFIVMEYVQGQTLAGLLKQKPTLLLMRKLQMMDQVCAGLHYAHRMGIVHRDIKPANLMIDDEGTMKILDFGIARMGASKITHTGVVIGTLNYMSPEQMKGQPTDPRSDIFSIGAVFYELLSYRSPFAGDAPSTVMHKVLYGHPDQLEVICPNLDPSLVAIVARCLEKQPGSRYPDLGAVRNAIGGAMRLLQASGADTVLEATQVATVAVDPKKDRGRTPGSDRKDSANVDRVRARAEQTRSRQLLAHIENAQRALEHGSYDLVFASCEQALVLDPTNQQALELEARARAEVDRQAQQRIVEARAEVDRGALTAASMLVDQVLALSPESADAQAVRQEIEEARVRLAVEQERARERGRALSQACADAERWLSNGSFEAANEAVQRALALDGSHQQALELKDKIAKAIADREGKRKADEEARARKAIEEARRLFGAGDQVGAFTTLESLRTHPAAASALAALKLEAKEIERRRAEADRARLEEEAARLKRETEAARAKFEAELERVKREREESHKKLEAEAAQLKREREEERKHAEAERQRVEEERKKTEAERIRLAREADAARVAREEEARRVARDAEAARVAREAEAARAKERERQAASRTEETLFDPRGANANAGIGALKPPVAPRPNQPPPLASRNVMPMPPPAARTDLAKFVALAMMGVAILVISSVLVLRNWGSSSQDAAVTQPVEVTQPPPQVATTTPPPQTTQAAIEPQQAQTPPPPPQEPQTQQPPVTTQQPPPARGAEPSQPPPVNPAPPVNPTLPVNPAPTGTRGASPPPSPPPAGSDNTQRTRELADRYTRAKTALDANQFATAIPLFEALQRDEPNYRDVPAELARARTGLATSARQALEAGATQEKAGDLPAALQQYVRARQIDPSQAATADAAANRVRTRMKNEGEAAFTNARQYDALDRIDQAIGAYDIAVRYLTDDDPNRKIARERLAALRARR